MKKVIIPGITAGVVLLITSIVGLYFTIWFLPNIAMQYFNPAFGDQSGKYAIYLLHPFVVGLALAWFWSKIKFFIGGSYLSRSIEFGAIYMVVAIFPFMLLLYSSIDVSISMLATWFVFGVVQGFISGLIFGKMNP